MSWPAGLAVAVTPASAASGNVVAYLLSYGPVGIFLVVLAWLMYRGWSLYSPARLNAERTACRTDLVDTVARLIADRDKERTRLIAERDKAAEQRDEALKAAADQLIPLLIQFTGATNSLLPLLQDVVRRQEAHDERPGR
jgi:hypothetical protein